MKALNICFGAAALVLVGQAATAAPLGAIEYNRFTNSVSGWQTDLGGVNAMADATVGWNDYNGAATLPGGLPLDYSIHIDRTFMGDGNRTSADWMRDTYYFKVDPATSGGATAFDADTSLTIFSGYDTGFSDIAFYIWENGGGGLIPTHYGDGRTVFEGFDIAQTYVLWVSGHLQVDDPSTAAVEGTTVGRYDVVMGLGGDFSLSPVPVPPALLLLLTGLGALFGFGRLRAQKDRELTAA